MSNEWSVLENYENAIVSATNVNTSKDLYGMLQVYNLNVIHLIEHEIFKILEP